MDGISPALIVEITRGPIQMQSSDAVCMVQKASCSDVIIYIIMSGQEPGQIQALRQRYLLEKGVWVPAGVYTAA